MGTMTTYARLLATLSILAPARGREEMISPELLASCSFTFCTICTLREFISAETESLGCSNLVSRAGIDLASALASSTAREPIWEAGAAGAHNVSHLYGWLIHLLTRRTRPLSAGAEEETASSSSGLATAFRCRWDKCR